MEVKPLEVLSEDSNLGVVRMPGRRFPGSVIQGDTLKGLVDLAGEIAREAGRTGVAPLAEAAAELYDTLRGRLAHYEAVLGRHGLELPYAGTPAGGAGPRGGLAPNS